jgi:hypothetical protein
MPRRTLRRRWSSIAILVGVLGAPAVARGQTPAPSADDARAQQLFEEGKKLRDAGDLAAGCSKLAESKKLAPGVGVSLHLGDCYEKMGKPGSAAREYQDAENLARGRGDEKRADLAHKRAQALEGKAGQITVASPSGPHEGWQFLLDGAPLAANVLDTPFPVDPGDHTVTINAPGQPARTLSVHVEAPNLVATIHTDAPTPPPSPAAPVPAPVPVPVPTPAEAPTTTTASPMPPAAVPSGGPSAARIITELALVGVGLAGAGLGTAFLINRNNAMNNDTPCDPDTVDQGDKTGAIISYSAGGVALGTALVLYLTNPHPHPMGLVVAPAFLGMGGMGGGGATFRGEF